MGVYVLCVGTDVFRAVACFEPSAVIACDYGLRECYCKKYRKYEVLKNIWVCYTKLRFYLSDTFIERSFSNCKNFSNPFKEKLFREYRLIPNAILKGYGTLLDFHFWEISPSKAVVPIKFNNVTEKCF